MSTPHRFQVTVDWTGNQGSGTSSYRAYSRAHEIRATGKPTMPGSSDPAFRGDPTRYNPEEMLIASLSSCHMLWYLHLCAVNNVVVTAYTDEAEGAMAIAADGSGRFSSVTLKPNVTITAESGRETALRLHEEAQRMCFIAQSVNFPVHHQVTING